MSDEASGKVYKLEASPGMHASSGFEVIAQVITYPQKLLLLAQKLIDSEEFSISVVAAHMACEVAADRAFTGEVGAIHISGKLGPSTFPGGQGVGSPFPYGKLGPSNADQGFYRFFKYLMVA